MGSIASFKSHHLRAGRAEYATTLKPVLVGPEVCELRATIPQRAGDDNDLCNVFCATGRTVPVAIRYSPAGFFGSGNAFERGREGIEREGAQQVAAQAALDFSETVGGALQPGKVGGFGHFLEFAQNV